MLHEREENELRARFRAWRQEEERQAPPFERSWKRAQAGRPVAGRPPGVFRWAAAAGALLVAFSLGALILFRPPGPPPAVVPISQWQSPTSFLLRSPGDPLLKTLPRLGAPAMEATTFLSKPGNGGSR